MAGSAGAVGSWLSEYGAAAAAAASAAASIGSAYAQNRSVNAQQEMQAHVLEQQREQQSALQDKASQAIAQTTANFTDDAQKQALANAAAQRAAAGTAAVAMPAPTSAGYQITTASAPTEVRGAVDRNVAAAKDNAQSMVLREAMLKAFGDTDIQNEIALQRGAQSVGQIANYSQGTSALVPLDIAAAHAAGSDSAGWSDVLNRAANIGAAYAATRNRQPKSGTPGWGAGTTYTEPGGGNLYG